MSRLAAALVGAGLVVVAVLGWFGAAVAGPRGVAVVAAAVFVAAALVARSALAASARPAGRRRGRPGVPAASKDAFPTFLRLTSAIYSGEGSRRHFDRVLRPMLWRLASAAAGARPGAAGADAAWVRDRIGDELWPLLDPGRPAWEDPPGESAQGPDIATLTRLVDGMERIEGG